jgi:hypothetical protein
MSMGFDDPTERKCIKEGMLKLRRNSRTSIFGKRHVERHLELSESFDPFLWERSYVLELFAKRGQEDCSLQCVWYLQVASACI